MYFYHQAFCPMLFMWIIIERLNIDLNLVIDEAGSILITLRPLVIERWA